MMAPAADETKRRGKRVEKSAQAFRTISEVADELELPQHVLRFWETKFTQVKPMKRGGGRRYYRPDDVTLLRHIRDLLYSEGYTIKGAQKLLRAHRGTITKAEEAEPKAAPAAPAKKDSARTKLEAALSELEELRDMLRGVSA
jgi:DNA-binding transcriptional MerR regulator